MTSTSGFTLGVVGGSGLYELDQLEHLEELHVATPFGTPSDAVVRGRLGGTTLLFLPRHGRGHRVNPSEINYRANVCAMKLLGADAVLAVSAVGSLAEEVAPGHLVVVDQFIDLTKRRASTFFEDGVVAHVSMADPVCPMFAKALLGAARGTGATVHESGTYVCIEGPQFSTRAESRIYRSWGASVIGMTNMPEAKLAREACLPYATLALSTDYDCWHESEADVSVELVVATMKRNVHRAKETIVRLAESPPDLASSPARRALDGALMTAPGAISAGARSRLSWLLPR